MKILHLHDCAGLAALYSHELSKSGIKSKILQYSPFDPFGFGRYYDNTSYFNHPNELLFRAEEIGRDTDWVILHDCPEYLDIFKGINRAVFYHGTRLRNQFKDIRIDNEADKIFLSCDDLVKYRPNATVLPKPIDTNLFKSDGSLKNQAQLMIQRDRDREIIEGYARTRFPNVLYRVRQHNLIPYEAMPNLLNQFGFYIDIQFDYSRPPNIIPNMSCTGLQALSCGLTVYDHKFDHYIGLPASNYSSVAAQIFLKELES